MKRERTYRAIRSGNTLLMVAGIGGLAGKARNVQLLVDTGAGVTILPVELLEGLGYDLTQPAGRIRLATANGLIVAPLIKVVWFNSLGQLFKNFPVAAHTIPSAPFDGVLGMDFLVRCQAVISTGSARLTCRLAKAGKT